MTPEEQLAHLRDGGAWNLAPLDARATRPPRRRHLLIQIAVPVAVGLVVAALITTGVTTLRGGSEPIAFSSATATATTTDTAEPTAGPTPLSSPPPPTVSRAPGSPVITTLSEPHTQTFTGTHTVQLGERPKKATGIVYTFTCLSTGGDVKFPDGSGITGCSATEQGWPTIDGRADPTPLNSGVDTFTVTATSGLEWKIETTWVESHISPLGTNANGQTYGSVAYGLKPHLIAAWASNGKEGYVYAKDLRAHETGCDVRSADYEQCQEDFMKSLPPVIVYESDGVTVIGHMTSPGSAYHFSTSVPH